MFGFCCSKNRTSTINKVIKPAQGSFQLNVDGCSKGNLEQSDSGCILRDAQGNTILAYSCYVGILTSVQAEVKTFLFGAQLCRQHWYSSIHVQLDLMIPVDILRNEIDYPWSVSLEIEELKSIQ